MILYKGLHKFLYAPFPQRICNLNNNLRKIQIVLLFIINHMEMKSSIDFRKQMGFDRMNQTMTFPR